MQATQPSNRTSEVPRRRGLVAPVAVLGLFAALLPVRLTSGHAALSDETCLTLGDRPHDADPGPLKLLETCSALYPGDVEVLADLGAACERTDTTRAEAVYRQVLQLDPGYADVRLKLGLLLLGRGAAAEAIRQADAGLTIQPNRQAFVELRRRAQALAGERP